MRAALDGSAARAAAMVNNMSYTPTTQPPLDTSKLQEQSGNVLENKGPELTPQEAEG